MARAAGRRDLVVFGASAGGVNALIEALADGSPLNAAVAIVVHMSATQRTVLHEILTRTTGMTARLAADGMPLERGVILVAPPDHHLLVGAETVRLSRGPRENRARPAVDPLFRSAAQSHGPRVVAVVLSGLLGDGAAGLAAVRAAGGVGIVQQPQDAIFPGMPLRALEQAGADRVLAAAEMRAAIEALVDEEVPAGMTDAQDEPDIVELGIDGIQRATEAGTVTPLSCPDCGGALWEVGQPVGGYRCRVGHAFSLDALVDGQLDVTETALWMAVRALEEHAATLQRAAERLDRDQVESRAAGRMRQGAERSLEHARVIRDLLARAV
jgi:two-component system chemotaxis response regulator CheB